MGLRPEIEAANDTDDGDEHLHRGR